MIVSSQQIPAAIGHSSDAGSKIAVLVLGAPRSGTSATAQLLSDMGVYFGAEESFVDPADNPHNPIFFELRKLNDLNEAILGRSGYQFGTFDCLLPPGGLAFSEERRDSDAAAIAELITGELGESSVIGLKDPRFVFTLPVWEPVLRSLGYVVKCLVTTRSDDAVVNSNMKVNGCSREHNQRLAWLSVSAAAVHTRGLDTFVLDFEQLLAEPASEAKRIAEWLGMDAAVASSATGSVDLRLRNESAGGPKLLSEDKGLEEVVTQYAEVHERLSALGLLDLIDQRRIEVTGLWEALRRCQQDIQQLGSASGVADFHGLVQRMQTGIGGELKEIREWMRSSEREAVAAGAAAIELSTRRIRDLESALFERISEIEQLRETLHGGLLERDRSSQDADGLRAELAALVSNIEAERAEWQAREASINMANARHIETLEREHSEVATRLQQDVDRKNGECELTLEELGRVQAALADARLPWYRKLMRR